MANGSLVQKPNGDWYARFRFNGKQIARSLGTKSEAEAKDMMGQIRMTLRKIEAGDLQIPADADLKLFITSQGKVSQAVTVNDMTLGEVIEHYQAHLPHGAKARSTLKTEITHFNHLRPMLGVKTPFRTITNQTLQTYVKARSKEAQGQTIRKEMGTFSVLWNYAQNSLNLVAGTCPTKGLLIQKTDEKEAFQTFAEIEAKLKRGGYSEEEEQNLWNCLFLTTNEIKEFLAFAEKQCEKLKLPAFVYPMIVTACMTGARRSELCKSEAADWKEGSIQIREKKRKQRGSFREVSIHEKLAEVIKNYQVWQEGRWMFSTQKNKQLTPDQATHYLERVTAKSKWSKIKGWHVFRHSFASNLAAAGAHQAVINAWMGHQTEEMTRRYRHLAPNEKQQTINLLNFG